MKPLHRVSLAGAALALASAAAFADLTITSYTIDGGGGTSLGGNFILSGTIGQPDAGTLSGGTFVLQGGFWPGASAFTCTADFNNDGIVNTPDLGTFLSFFGHSVPAGTPEDLNSDGIVNTFDLSLFLQQFGMNCNN